MCVKKFFKLATDNPKKTSKNRGSELHGKSDLKILQKIEPKKIGFFTKSWGTKFKNFCQRRFFFFLVNGHQNRV